MVTETVGSGKKPQIRKIASGIENVVFQVRRKEKGFSGESSLVQNRTKQESDEKWFL